MDSNIVAAIISVVGAIIVALADRFFLLEKRRTYHEIGKGIRNSINGNWEGVFRQKLEGQQIEVPITCVFRVTRKGRVTGVFKFSYSQEPHTINVKGGFYLLNFLKLEYENADEATTQFGSFVLERLPDSKILVGCFVGYGYRTRRVISGPIKIHKINSISGKSAE